MPNDKQLPETTSQQQGTQWKKGQSGNPSGRPVGARHKATMAAQALLDGEAEELTRKAVELAKTGDLTALRLCLERIIPPKKDTPVLLDLPALKTPADIVAAHGAIADAVASGEITPMQGRDIADIVVSVGKSIELVELEGRLTQLEQRMEGNKK